MKRFSVITLGIFALTSCTSLVQQKESGGYKLVLPSSSSTNFTQENVLINYTNASEYANAVSRDLAKAQNVKHDFLTIKGTIEMYAGGNLEIKNTSANRFEIRSAPVGSGDFKLTLSNNTLNFNSIYQGEYIIDIFNGPSFGSTIKINNKLKYNFYENDVFNVIQEANNTKNFEMLSKAIRLYNVAFPEGLRKKDVLIINLDLVYVDESYKMDNQSINNLKTSYMLTESEKIKLFEFENKYRGRNSDIDAYYLAYNSGNINLNMLIANAIKLKSSQTDAEIDFLERLYLDSQSSEIAVMLATIFKKSGNEIKSDYYSKLSSTAPSDITVVIEPTSISTNDFDKGVDAFDRKSYEEAIVFFNKSMAEGTSDKDNINYYLGMTNFNLNNFENAITYFNSIKNTGDKTSEIFYYIGVSNHKLGKNEEAKQSLRKSRDNSPKSTWGRKSSIYLLNL